MYILLITSDLLLKWNIIICNLLHYYAYAGVQLQDCISKLFIILNDEFVHKKLYQMCMFYRKVQLISILPANYNKNMYIAARVFIWIV